MKHFLKVEKLTTHFPIQTGLMFRKTQGVVRAVDGVSFTLDEGQSIGLVGESGCGKTTLGRTIMRLIRPTSGRIVFMDQEIQSASEAILRPMRSQFQMIFQDPFGSLNPRMTIFDTLSEPFIVHHACSREEIPKKVAQLMDRVGLSPNHLKKYPHEFSGGQRQRIAIARSIALSPKLVVADEPVSALDVSIQSQIINLLMDLKKELKLSLLFISHDLSAVRHVSDQIAVMYLGQIVEMGDAEKVFNNPKHPYTRALLSAMPFPDPNLEKKRKHVQVEGEPPSPFNPPKGCRFHPRCKYMIPACSKELPALEALESDQHVACIRAKEI